MSTIDLHRQLNTKEEEKVGQKKADQFLPGARQASTRAFQLKRGREEVEKKRL